MGANRRPFFSSMMNLGVGLVPLHDPFHDLIQAQLAGIEFDGILGHAQGRHLAGAIGFVTVLKIGEHVIEDRFLTLGFQFEETPVGTGFGAGC
jgi:hypothetical protein